MKILVLANALLNREIASGGDILSQELLKRIDTVPKDIIFMVPEISEEYFKRTFPESRIVCIYSSFIDNEKNYSKYLFLIFPVYMIRAVIACLLIRNIETDIIITTGDFFCNSLPAFFKKGMNKKVKWISHLYHVNPSPFIRKGNSILMSIASYMLQRFSFKLIKKKADRVILLNREVESQLETLGFDKTKLFIMGGGINYKKIQEVPSSKMECYDLCSLGRINPTKGVFDLPEIMRQVVDKKRDTKLLIMGSGTDNWMNKLKEKFEKYSLSNNIIIKGYVPTDEMYGLMKSCKIFVSPSYEEGWGIAVCEGIACGLPVVAYDLPVYREYFEKVMKLVGVGDKNKFAEAILCLLNNSNERKKLGKDAIDIASQYDWDTVAKKYMEQIRLIYA